MNFGQFELHPTLLQSTQKLGYKECTPIQEAAIPLALEGKDISGLAQTGTGKTAAFLVPLIDRVLRSMEATALHTKAVESSAAMASATDEAAPKNGLVQASSETAEIKSGPLSLRLFDHWTHGDRVLVLVPTRELAEQVSEAFQSLKGESSLSAAVLYGGMAYEPQKERLQAGAEFVIGTPGRIIDLYKSHDFNPKRVRAVVFDEADRMFDMGFKDDMRFLLQRIPRERQFLVFSATLNFEVQYIAYEFEANPVELNLSKDEVKAENVADEILHIGHDEKPRVLLSILKRQSPEQCIIFSNFKHNVPRLAQFLSSNGFAAVGISSLLTQAQRNRVLEQFKTQSGRNILVATDLAARGLDIKGVDLVINYDLPDDAENYVHRIGRTGRAEEQGAAVSLVGDRDVEALQRIETYLKSPLKVGWIEEGELVEKFEPFPQDRDLRDKRSRMPTQPFPGAGRGGNGKGRDSSRRSTQRGARPPRAGSDREAAEGGSYERSPRARGPRRDGTHHEASSAGGAPVTGAGQHSRGTSSPPRSDARRSDRRNRQRDTLTQRGSSGEAQKSKDNNQQRKGQSYRAKSRSSSHRHAAKSASSSKDGSIISKITGAIRSLFR
ncbi:MAG: ATP-dependent helicase [Bdellovibrionales bacterium CG10_big_fil_rev_8_21_14_0_10_45_34]|nr:MAG: ATP-dependent helicase [Bdellovibrionales bacterium CG10_big_fil_rev_8_21_14_0_10_45_34]